MTTTTNRPFQVGDIVAPNFSSPSCHRAMDWRSCVPEFRLYPWTQATRFRVVAVHPDTVCGPTMEVQSADGCDWLRNDRECWQQDAFMHAELIFAGYEEDIDE